MGQEIVPFFIPCNETMLFSFCIIYELKKIHFIMDLLNLNNDKFVDNKGEGYSDENLLQPNPQKGQNNTYKAVFRWLPYWKNTDQSKYKKYVAVLTNPLTKDKLAVDCPSTVKKSSVLWTIDIMLRNKEKDKIDLDVVNEIKKNFNRFMNFYSPIYIYKDPQDTALEGTIKIYNFGHQIDKMIQTELNPEDELIAAKKINPYSLIEGKDFLLVVKQKTRKFKTYESSKFVDQVTPFRFKTETGEHVVTQEELVATSKGENTPIAAFLKAKTPDMEKYHYKEWTDKTYKDVAAFIKAIIPYKDFMAELIEEVRDERMKELLLSNVVAASGTGSVAKNEIAAKPADNTKGGAPIDISQGTHFDETTKSSATDHQSLLEEAEAETNEAEAETEEETPEIPADTTPKGTGKESDEFSKMLNEL